MYDERKAAEAAAVLLAESGGRMRYLRLLKLLYLADRRALKEWERPITNDTYASMPWGPVPSLTCSIVRGTELGVGDEWSRYVERVSKYWVGLRQDAPRIGRLSQAEIDVLLETVRENQDLGSFTLSSRMHVLPEYEDPKGSSKPISLETLFKALDFDEREIQRISRELEAEAEIDSVLRP